MSETIQAMAIPEDVLAFARGQGVEDFLPDVLEAASRLMPGLFEVHCALDQDDEAATWHLVVVLRGVNPDAERTLAAYDSWHRALFAIVGAPRVCLFRLDLERPA